MITGSSSGFKRLPDVAVDVAAHESDASTDGAQRSILAAIGSFAGSPRQRPSAKTALGGIDRVGQVKSAGRNDARTVRDGALSRHSVLPAIDRHGRASHLARGVAGQIFSKLG
jgi:hypothetical protein